MNSSNILFIGMMVTVLQAVALSKAPEKLPCGFEDATDRLAECIDDNIEDLFPGFFSNSNVVTGKDVLPRVEKLCSNYESLMKCVRCKVKRECPEEQAAISAYVEDKWSAVCNEDQPADWLQAALQTGYSFNQSCSFNGMSVFNDCFTSVLEERLYNRTYLMQFTVDEGIDVLMSLTADIYTCSVGRILTEPTMECESSWQDILLTVWLKVSLTGSLRLSIGEKESRILERIRCTTM